MHEESTSGATFWAKYAAAALALCVLLAPATVQAQSQIQLNRQLTIVPRHIRGKAVESVVINRVVLLFGELPAAEPPADAKGPADQDPKPKQGVIVFSGKMEDLVRGKGLDAAEARAKLDELVFGDGASAAGVLARLEERLQKKLETIDRVSGLTEAQKQKLQLAGHGDLKRLFDRAEKLRELCDGYFEIADLDQFQKWAAELKSETKALRQPLAAGPFGADSFLARSMKTTLTAEQAAKYARFAATPPYPWPPNAVR